MTLTVEVPAEKMGPPPLHFQEEEAVAVGRKNTENEEDQIEKQVVLTRKTEQKITQLSDGGVGGAEVMWLPEYVPEGNGPAKYDSS